MNRTINLLELHDRIRDNFIKNGYKVQTDRLKKFLMGRDTKEEEVCYDVFTKKRRLTEDQRERIINAKFEMGAFKECFSGSYQKKISQEVILKQIYTDYIGEDSEKKEYAVMLRELVFQAVFGTQFPMVFPVSRKAPCSTHVPWEEKRLEIRKRFEDSNIVIVSGEGGSGKTQLIKYYLQQEHYTDISYNEVEDVTLGRANLLTLKEQLQNIEIIYPTYKDKIEPLKEQDENVIVILERPIFREEDGKFVAENFAGQKVRILITARQVYTGCEFPMIDCNSPSLELLRSIFEKNLGEDKELQEYLNDEEFETLTNNLSSNILMISIAAKALTKIMGKNDFVLQAEFKKQFLNINAWKKVNTIFSEINFVSYSNKKGQNKPIYYLVLLLYKYELIPYELNTAFSEIALWTKTYCPLSLIEQCRRKHVDEKLEHALKKLLELGVLEEDDDMVKIHSIVADAIWINKPISFKEYRKEMGTFVYLLDSNSVQISNINLYQMICNIVSRFSFPQKNEEENLEGWLEVVSAFLCILHYRGSIKYMGEVLDLIEMIEKNYSLDDLQLETFEGYLAYFKLFSKMNQVEHWTDLGDYINEHLGNRVFLVEIMLFYLKQYDRMTEPVPENMTEILRGYRKTYNLFIEMLTKSGNQNLILEECLYHRGVLDFWEYYYCEKPKYYQLDGLYELEECRKIAHKRGNTEVCIRSILKHIFLRIFYSFFELNDGQMGIDESMMNVREKLNIHSLSWENALLYEKLNLMYSVYHDKKINKFEGIENSLNMFLQEIRDRFDIYSEKDIDSLSNYFEIQLNAVKKIVDEK